MGGGTQYGQSGGYRPPQGGFGQPQAGRGMGGIGGAPGYSLSGAGEGGRFGGGNAPPALNYGGWGAPPNAGIGGGGASPGGDGLGTIYAEQRSTPGTPPGAVLDPIEWDRNGKIGLGGMVPDAGIGGGGGAGLGGDAGNGYAPPGAYGPRWATWQGPLPGTPGVYKPKMNTGLEPGPWGGSGTPIQSPGAPPSSPGLPPARGNPPPGDPRRPLGAKAGPDAQMASFMSLYQQDPRLAYGYSFGGNAQPWFVQNQGLLRDNLFGGNQDALNQFINGASYANPLTLAERQRIQGMAGY